MGNKITITRGSFGVDFTITVSGETLQKGDNLNFVIKLAGSKERLIEKSYTINELSEGNITEINVRLTEEESNKLKVEKYKWGVEQTRVVEGKTILKDDLLIDEDFTGDFIVLEGV